MYRWTSLADIGLGMAYGNRMTKMERKIDWNDGEYSSFKNGY